jgi:predicted enzyme related to lactoylglutathione lyase
MSHPVVRWQVISPDPDATVEFYRKLFQWETDRANALGYREIPAAEGGMAGGVWPGPEQSQPFVQLFVSVPDVEQHVSRAMSRCAFRAAWIGVASGACRRGDSVDGGRARARGRR